MDNAVRPSTPPDLTLDQIMRHFATDEQARKYLEAVRWPDGVVCPHCGNADSGRIWRIAPNPKKKIRPGLYDCAECKRQFTVMVGTIFEDSHVPLRKWLVAWYLLSSSKKGFSALQLQRSLGLGSYRTAWFMLHRIRYALRDPAFAESDKLTGTVEADEAYIGGKPRYKQPKPGPAKGWLDRKTPVVALVERQGRVRSTTVDRVTGQNLRRILDEHIDHSSRLMTDEHPVYQSLQLDKTFAGGHHTVNHSAGEYVRGDVTTNTIESYFAILKRGINGIYHHIGKPYVGQYLGEFDFRYNHRKVTDGQRTVAGLRKAEGKRLMLRRPTPVAS